MRLYELDNEAKMIVAALEDGCDPETGEVIDDTSPLKERLDQIEIDISRKLLWCGALYKDYDGDANKIGDEIKALQKRKKAAENRANGLKEFIGFWLSKDEKLEDARVKLSWRKNPASVELDEDWEEALPEEFINIEKSPKKKEILAALKTWTPEEPFPGAKIGKETKSVQIR